MGSTPKFWALDLLGSSEWVDLCVHGASVPAAQATNPPIVEDRSAEPKPHPPTRPFRPPQQKGPTEATAQATTQEHVTVVLRQHPPRRPARTIQPTTRAHPSSAFSKAFSSSSERPSSPSTKPSHDEKAFLPTVGVIRADALRQNLIEN